MKKRIAAIITVILMLAFLCSAVMADEVSVGETLDTGAAGSGASVSLQASTPEELKEEYEAAKVVLDFYCLAIFDNGVYELTDAYKDLDLSAYDLEKHEDETDDEYADRSAKELAGLAQEALQMTFAPDSTAVPAYPAQKLDEKILDVPLGMYLVLPHGSDLTPEKYVKKVKDNYVTIAQTPEKEFRFLPIISMLNYDKPDGEFELKLEGDGREGAVKIVKTIESFETAEEVTFVFRVIGKDEKGAVAFNEVASLTFDGTQGSDSITIDKIPVGLEVSVKEIYSGSAYVQTSPDPEPVTIVADETKTVLIGGDPKTSFYNKYNDEEKHGHGFMNSFKFNGSTWEWYKDGVLQTGSK